MHDLLRRGRQFYHWVNWFVTLGTLAAVLVCLMPLWGYLLERYL